MEEGLDTIEFVLHGLQVVYHSVEILHLRVQLLRAQGPGMLKRLQC